MLLRHDSGCYLVGHSRGFILGQRAKVSEMDHFVGNDARKKLWILEILLLKFQCRVGPNSGRVVGDEERLIQTCEPVSAGLVVHFNAWALSTNIKYFHVFSYVIFNTLGNLSRDLGHQASLSDWLDLAKTLKASSSVQASVGDVACLSVHSSESGRRVRRHR